jgi:hypothetical protein
MMVSRLLIGLLVVAVVAVGSEVSAQSPTQVQATMNVLPQSTNALAIFRFDALMKTPLGQTEQWSQYPEKLGIETVPAWVKWGIVAKELDPVRGQLWEIGLAPLPAQYTLADLAKEQGLTVQTVGDVPVARGTERNAYYLQLPGNNDGKTFALVYPAAYRFVSQWISALTYRTSPPVFAPTLTTASGKTAHVIMALDLRSVFDPLLVQDWVGKTWRETQGTQTPANVATFLTGLEGVSVTMISTTSMQATLTIHSSADIKLSPDWIKRVFEEILTERNLEVDELESLQFQISEKTATATFTVQPHSLRQFMSLWLSPHLQAPSADPVPPAATDTPQVTRTTPQQDRQASEDAVYKASQNYYRSVNQMLDDLSRASRRSTNYLQTATYHDRYAQKIIDLPYDGVPNELLQFGGKIADYLKALASSLRGMYISVNTDEKSITYQSNYNPGWASASVWGAVGGQMPYYNVTSNVENVREKQADTIKKATEEREKIWLMIDRERTRMKLELTDRFGAAFVEGK